jgi:arginyl-tRNA synthetase
MADPITAVESLLLPVMEAVAGRAGVDPVVRPSEHADAQINAALGVAKQLGQPPRKVAQEILDQIAASPACQGVFASLEIAGPGFINLAFSDEFLVSSLREIAVDPRLGVTPVASARRVVIDYSAPNVAKEMHVGHLRTTVIGDALARMLRFMGHEVILENHVGDWGTPFGMLIEHLIDLGEDQVAAELSLGDLDGFYKQARNKFDGSDEFQDRSRHRVVLLQSGDVETTRLWELLVGLSTKHFNTVYDALGVLLTDDDLAGESKYQPLMGQVITRLTTAGLLSESEGADVVFVPGFTNREGDPLPLIVQKGAGGFNYATSDLACVIDRVERLGADLMLYVVGAPQQQHLSMVFAVAELAGWLSPPAEAVHVSFGSVLGPDRKMLKSRSGDPMKFADLLTEAASRAGDAVAAKNPELGAEQRSEIARAVGIGAVKYSDLSTDRVRDYVFDWDRMLSFDGNTAPYLQYAHARICSIFRRSQAADGSGEISLAAIQQLALTTPQERALALGLLAYPSALADTLSTYSPHKLCTYLFSLSQLFTSFYEHCPVLNAPAEVRSSRLVICDLTARTLSHGLGLLGIDTPEQM